MLIERNNPNPLMALYGHEITHRMQELAPKEYRAFREIVAEKEQGSVQKRIDAYAAQGVELTREQALDEVAADYAGRMIDDGKVLDDFIAAHKDDRTLLQKVRDAIRAILDKLTGAEKKKAESAEAKLTAALEAAAEQAKQLEGKKNTAQTDGEARYSIKQVNGKEVVWIENSLLTNKELNNHRAVAEFIAQHIGEVYTIIESGQKVYLGEDLPGEYTHSNYTDSIRRRAPSLLKAKNKAASDLGLLIETATNRRWEKTKHTDSKDAKYGMYRYDVSFAFQSKGNEPKIHAYDAELLIRNASDGKKYLYDIVKIKENNADVIDLTSRETRLADYKSASQGVASTASIRQSDESVNGKFSLKAPVEETDKLIAVHNKDENSILEALKLGGMPMPSIAIVKARDGHTKYGPISLVFSKDTIDPQFFRANKVYGGDAWTPTAPRVEYPVNSKKASQLEHELHRLAGDTSVAGGIFGNGAALRSIGIDDTSIRSTAELAEKLASTDTVRAAYLAEQGKSLEPVKMDKVWDKFGNDTLQKVIDRLGVNTLAEIESSLVETGESVKDALGENAEVIRDILRDYYREKGEPMLRRMAAKRGWTNAEINEKRQARIDKSMDEVSIFALEDIVYHALDMYQDGGTTKGEIDRMATSDALRSAVDDRAVEEWIAGKLDGLLGEAGIYNGKAPYTPSGNSRSFSQLHYAYTLENIVKAMKEGQEERGGNTWGASAKTLQSVATPEYRSIQEIKADSGRLGMDEGAEYEAKLQSIDDQIDSIITRVKQGNSAHSDNPLIESDIIGSILMETAKGKKTVDAIMRAFSKEGYKISSQTAQDIQAVYQAAAEMPTGYFEAKPQRAVGFDEVLAAVIPDDSSEKLRDGLEQAGVRMLEYKTGDDMDRLAKVNSVEGARFSLKAGTESKSYAALQEENQLLREQMKDYMQLQRRSSTLEESRDYWRGQTQRTRRVTTDKKAVAAAAKSFIKEYSSDLEVADIQEDLQRLYDYIASGYDGKDELTYPEARRRAEKIAEKLVTNAVEADTELYNQYSDLRHYLRSTKIVFGKEYQSQIADYSDFRKAQFGRLKLGSQGATNVDQVYQELSENWPEFFSDYCGSFCAVRSFTTSPATISPAVAGTKALLPGTCRRCVHFRAVPGGQMQCVRQLMDRSSSGVMGGSFE